ncbi:hypothetical protein DSO57_1005695 [Entomophthora muscae]|uniref:Uncharacterized protein n=1 Tax=Entomophthora muscae TaxID=34485 RepID=A0ACC2TVQ3_9FUNG|nr:hypothetical protein DSO57_1005695 [Entomophthora muscae]
MLIGSWLLSGILVAISGNRLGREEPLKYYEFFDPKTDFVDNQFYPLTRDMLTLRFNAFNRTYSMFLQRSNILHEDATITTLADKQTRPLKGDDYQLYEGHVASSGTIFISSDEEKDWAKLVVRESDVGLSYSGVFQAGGKIFNIKPLGDYLLTRRAQDPIITQHSPRSTSTLIFQELNTGDGAECGAVTEHLKPALFRRDAGEGCTKRKTLYLGAVLDCKYIKRFKTQRDAEQTMFRDWSIVSGLFKPAKISIKVARVVVANCDNNSQDSIGASINDIHKAFSSWASKNRVQGLGVWHLHSANETSKTLGIASVGDICHPSSTSVSLYSGKAWITMAHELAHNLGAPHDCTRESCLAGENCCRCHACDCKQQFLMHPSYSNAASFSPCTINTLCNHAPHASCLVSSDLSFKPTDQKCGNGIVEGTEQCDSQRSRCCDPMTCQFINNAQCDDANESCCQDCQIMPAGSVCRPTQGQCDKEETCTGTSSKCPEDQFMPNGMACGSAGEGLSCASGYCTSPDHQCQAVSQFRNVTFHKDCYPSSCKLACSGGDGQCALMSPMKVDGTLCGYKSYCQAGICSPDGFGNRNN